jgi:CTP-dependent riboflavin kinase
MEGGRLAENATPSMCSQDDLSGIVEPGRGLGAGLMADEAVMERLVELAGFPVVPGTLNVRLPQPLERGSRWRYVAAAEITPDWEARTGQAGYFLAPVLVAERYRGLAFQAVERGEPGYPPDQIELFCEAHLRRELGLGDGDRIAVRLRDDR